MNILFTGDIEEDAERLLAEQTPTTTLLKVPHHGSQTSSTPTLLDATTPQHAIFSTVPSGRRPAIGKGILERYQASNITPWRTDKNGGIRIRQKDGQLIIQGARQLREHTPE